MTNMTPEKIMEIGFSILQDADLMAKLSTADSAKDAFGMISNKLEGITYEEFATIAASLAPMIPPIPDEQLMAMPNGQLFIKIKQWLTELPIA